MEIIRIFICEFYVVLLESVAKVPSDTLHHLSGDDVMAAYGSNEKGREGKGGEGRENNQKNQKASQSHPVLVSVPTCDTLCEKIRFH